MAVLVVVAWLGLTAYQQGNIAKDNLRRANLSAQRVQVALEESDRQKVAAEKEKLEAERQRGAAEKQKLEAERQRREAVRQQLISQSQILAAQAEQILAPDQPAALGLALRAWPTRN